MSKKNITAKRFLQNSDDISSGIDLNPMLDVVCILLIFFIVTASFIKELGLPEYSGNDNADSDAAKPVIEVRIRQDSRVLVNGSDVSLKALRARIVHSLYRLGTQASVLIIAETGAKVSTYVDVVDAIQQARTNNISLRIDNLDD